MRCCGRRACSALYQIIESAEHLQNRFIVVAAHLIPPDRIHHGALQRFQRYREMRQVNPENRIGQRQQARDDAVTAIYYPTFVTRRYPIQRHIQHLVTVARYPVGQPEDRIELYLRLTRQYTQR